MHRGNGSGLMLKVSAQDTPRSIASGAATKGGERRRRDGAAPEMMERLLPLAKGGGGWRADVEGVTAGHVA